MFGPLKAETEIALSEIENGEPIKPCDGDVLFERNSHIHPSSHPRTPTTNPTHIRRDIDGFRTRTLLKHPSFDVNSTRFVSAG